MQPGDPAGQRDGPECPKLEGEAAFWGGGFVDRGVERVGSVSHALDDNCTRCAWMGDGHSAHAQELRNSPRGASKHLILISVLTPVVPRKTSFASQHHARILKLDILIQLDPIQSNPTQSCPGAQATRQGAQHRVCWCDGKVGFCRLCWAACSAAGGHGRDRGIRQSGGNLT